MKAAALFACTVAAAIVPGTALGQYGGPDGRPLLVPDMPGGGDIETKSPLAADLMERWPANVVVDGTDDETSVGLLVNEASSVALIATEPLAEAIRGRDVLVLVTLVPLEGAACDPLDPQSPCALASGLVGCDAGGGGAIAVPAGPRWARSLGSGRPQRSALMEEQVIRGLVRAEVRHVRVMNDDEALASMAGAGGAGAAGELIVRGEVSGGVVKLSLLREDADLPTYAVSGIRLKLQALAGSGGDVLSEGEASGGESSS